MPTTRSLAVLLGCILLCFAVAAVGAWVTTPAISGWYAGLEKPAWTPPNWLFPVAWNILYLMMAVALWRLIVRAPAGERRTMAIGLFAVQLALNAAWSPVFFGLHWIGVGLAIIVLLWLAILATIRAAWPVDRTAAWLLVPYLAWVTYASSLNAGILLLNRA